jgi:O-antigen/teichoic acid export membrane protein
MARPDLTRAFGLGREALWVGLGQALAAGAGLFGVRVLSGLLDPSAYGRLALALTFAALIQQLLLGPLAAGLLRFFAPAQEAGALEAYRRAGLALFAGATLRLAAVTAAIGAVLLVTGRVRWVGLLAATLAFALFAGYNGAADAVQSAARQRAVVAMHQGVGQWLRVASGAGLAWLVAPIASLVMLGYALASSLVFVSQQAFLRRLLGRSRREPPPPREAVWSSRIRNYASPFALWGLFTWAQGASDRWALQLLDSTASVGSYAVLYQLGYYPIALLTNSMVQMLSPILFRRAGDASDAARMDEVRRLGGRILAFSFALTALGGLLAQWLHDPIFRLLVAPPYRAVAPLLPLMVVSGGLFASGQVAVLSLLSDTRTDPLIRPKIVTAVLGVVLNLAGAWLFGLRGVVGGVLVFSAAYLAWILRLLREARLAGRVEPA